jgi:AAA+ superfamily predicted ATPase
MNRVCNYITHPLAWTGILTIGGSALYWQRDRILESVYESVYQKAVEFVRAKADASATRFLQTPAMQKICSKAQNITGKTCTDMLSLVKKSLNFTAPANHSSSANPVLELQKIATSLGNQGKASFRQAANEEIESLMSKLLSFGIFGILALSGTAIAAYYLYRKAKANFNRPKLEMEIHERTLFTSLAEQFKGARSSSVPSRIQPVYHRACERRIEEIARAMRSAHQTGSFFPNVIFYGPSGTGKTLLCEAIANDAKMSYLKISAPDLVELIKTGQHVAEFNRLMDKMNRSWRPWSTSPWIFIIDQADVLFRSGSTPPTRELEALQNAFLKQAGKQSKTCAILLAAERIEEFHPGVLSRMDHKIYLPLPDASERRRILKAHAKNLFSPSEQTSFFSDANLAKYAKATPGFSGRALAKMFYAIASKKAATHQRLSQNMIDETIMDFVAQENNGRSRPHS